MYARVNEFSGTKALFDEEVARSGDIASQVDAMPGSLGLLYMVDMDGEKALAITFWDSEASMKTSEAAASQVRGESTRSGIRAVGVGRYMVAVNTSRLAAG